MKILLMFAASALSAALVLPTVSQGQKGAGPLEPLVAMVQQPAAPIARA